MKQLYFILFLLVSHMVTIAQQPTWTAKLGTIGFNEIQFIKKAGTGVVLVSTANKIYGVSADQKKIIWEQANFNSLTDSSITAFPGSPLISIDGRGNFGIKGRNSLVNSETGVIVYSDKDEEGKKSGETFLQKKMALLTEFKDGKEGYIVYRSMIDGKEKWRKNFTASEAKMKGLLGAITNLAGLFVMSTEKRNDVNENIIINTATKIFYLNGATGEEIWTKTTDKNIISVVRSNDDKYLFYQAGGKLNYCDVNTGVDVLQKPIKENDAILSVRASNNGYIVNTGHGSNIITAEGAYKFKKNLCKKYSVYDMVQLEDGYIFTNYNDNVEMKKLMREREIAMAKADNKPVPPVSREALFVSKYDFEGNKIWEKVFMEYDPQCYFMPKGIFVTSNNLGAFYNYSDGKEIEGGEKIKFYEGASFGYGYDSLQLYVYSRGTITMFDLLNGTHKKITTGFRFSDELKSNEKVYLDVLKEGIFLNSNQNYALIGFDGKVKYSKSMVDLTGVSQRFKNRLDRISTTIGVIGFFTQVSSIVKEVNNGNTTEPKNFRNMKRGDDLMTVGLVGKGIAAGLNAVFNETKKSNNTICILTNDGSPAAVVINKATGAEVKRVKILDPKPLMYVDDVTNTLYVVTTLLDLKVYDLN
jgi:hypothetical protein